MPLSLSQPPRDGRTRTMTRPTDKTAPTPELPLSGMSDPTATKKATPTTGRNCMTTIATDLEARKNMGAGPLTERFDEALTYASAHHRNQLRKGSQVPYMSHLMSVSALV